MGTQGVDHAIKSSFYIYLWFLQDGSKIANLFHMKWWARVRVSNPNPLKNMLGNPLKSIYMVLGIHEPIKHDLILILWFYIIFARLEV